MVFKLSGVGGGLETPCVVLIRGDESDAMRVAHQMLEEHPGCDEIEIFSGQRFVRDVCRTPRQRVA